MAQLLVPDKVYLICSDGMTMRQLTVTSQTSVLMAAGRPVATVEDRMDGNFNCVKMIIAGAIVGAIIGAVIATATVATGGAALAAVGAAVVCTAGGAAVGGLAGLIPCICSMLTSDWMPFHPQINVENKHPILENSKIPCKLGGMVEICYSKALAKAKQDFKRKETALNLLALAGASAAGRCGWACYICVFTYIYGARIWGKSCRKTIIRHWDGIWHEFSGRICL